MQIVFTNSMVKSAFNEKSILNLRYRGEITCLNIKFHCLLCKKYFNKLTFLELSNCITHSSLVDKDLSVVVEMNLLTCKLSSYYDLIHSTFRTSKKSYQM